MSFGLCIAFPFIHYLSVWCPNTIVPKLISCLLQALILILVKFRYSICSFLSVSFVGKYALLVQISYKLNDYDFFFILARDKKKIFFLSVTTRDDSLPTFSVNPKTLSSKLFIIPSFSLRLASHSSNLAEVNSTDSVKHFSCCSI